MPPFDALTSEPATRQVSTSPIAVAGATGFIGRALPELFAGVHLIGLSRGGSSPGYDEQRVCDLFSARDAERALEGAKVGIYLVHSMMPSSRLVQGRFEDLDLICADNFARAAKRAGLDQIVYVGGLVPPAGSKRDALSPHLESRREVEAALGNYGVPVTALRAGLVVGRGGSSLDMLVRLVERLPMMVTPRWTSTKCQPIALSDMLALLRYVVGRQSTFGQTYDVGGPDVLSYREMMVEVAGELGVRRPTVPVPVLSPKLSTLWVSLVTGAPRELVRPLVQSLEHEMTCADRRLQIAAGVPGKGFRQALVEAGVAKRRSADEPRARAASKRVSAPFVARSVQRLPLPPGRDAAWIAAEYMRWLPKLRALHVEVGGDGSCRFFPARTRVPLLELSFSKERSTPDRQLFYVTGGVLAKPSDRSRLEFRETTDKRSALAAVHDFRPRLPFWLYALTHARVHVWVMNRFAVHLRALVTEQSLASLKEPE